jgi:hypothetical protein
MSALLSPSSLLCERCHGHGFLKTRAGRQPCLNCGAANDASPWTPASQPPASEPGQHGGISIECVGLVRAGGYRGPEIVAYWPAVGTWTVTRKDQYGELFDADIEVTHYMELPELPLEDAA